MPAKNCEQYRAAGAAAGRGESWGEEMVKKTDPAMRKRCAESHSSSRPKSKPKPKSRRGKR